MRPESHSIHSVLTKNATSFFIPPFQRAYSWGKPEIERYFSDIIRIIKSELNPDEPDKSEHFFGTIVLKEEQHGFAHQSVVVDGQQRLTTTLLFLIALRDVEPDENFKNRITNRYLRNEDSDFEDKIKLKQVTRDWDAYKALVNGQEPAPGIIKVAYNIFLKLINDTKKTNPNITANHYILATQRMNVAVIFLDERPHKGEDPQIIFETLNSLGKPLTLADLVRNFILLSLHIKKQSKIYETVWQPKIEQVLEENTSKFYRDYLQYKTISSIKVVSDERADANTKEVYQIFRDFVSTKFHAKEEFIEDIVRFVPWYKWIVTEVVTDTISSDIQKDKEVKELLRNIFHDIKAESFKPLVLGVLEYNQSGVNGIKLTDAQLVEILSAIRTYLIRRRILSLGQGENKNIVTLSSKIEKLAKLEDSIWGLLCNQYYKLRLPNDDEVNHRLKTADFYNSLKKYSKFILGKIEESRTKVSVDFRDSKITIEHIMPQQLSNPWKHELGNDFESIHKHYLHSIGNLILTEFNTEIGNKSFAEKKQKIRESSLSYRLDIIDKDSWNENDMNMHADNMIRRFIDTFSLPQEYQHSDNWNTSINDTTSFSPLEEDAGEIAEGNKPYKMIINQQTILVSTWQDLFVRFIKWLKESSDYDSEHIFEQQSKFFGREDMIIKWKNFRTIIDENPEYKNRYKTLDGRSWNSNLVDLTDDTEFVYVTYSAKSFMSKIAGIMEHFDMPESFIEIVLK